MKLKHLSSHGFPSALTKAERYRLLNEPEEAESSVSTCWRRPRQPRGADRAALVSRPTSSGGTRRWECATRSRSSAARHRVRPRVLLRAHRGGGPRRMIVAKLPGQRHLPVDQGSDDHYERAELLAPMATRTRFCLERLRPGPPAKPSPHRKGRRIRRGAMSRRGRFLRP